ncbi:MAG: protein-glutamate O-methyltransferase CheR [Granulosicoccus sp.]
MKNIDCGDFELVRKLVYRQSAIALDRDMKYLVESRLSSLARKTSFSDIHVLLAALRKGRDAELEGRVVEAMTTNETSFFRDSHPFETLCNELLPSIAQRHSDTINIWCAACSTGQEPYTIAMAIYERCPELVPRISIFASDLSSEVVAKADSGRYNKLEVNRGLPIQYLTKYFVQNGLAWQVTPKIRDLVRFDTLNLIGDWGGLQSMDVVFLRNVLIYFDPEMKTRVLKRTGEILKPGGCLFLGQSETTLNLKTDYQRVTTDRSHYYKLS